MAKNNKNIPSPHDRFFKVVFSDKAKVEDYLKGTLPEDIKDKIVFESLTLDNNSYVDEELKNQYSDMVYNVLFDKKQPVKIAFLF